jgi:hypothetical protein
MSNQDERIVPMGQHVLRIDSDSLFLEARGTLTVSDMQVLIDHFGPIKRAFGILFVFYDGRKSTGIDPAARKLATTHRSDQTDADLRVAFGIPFGVRVLLNMILRAQKVLTHRDVSVHVFDKENDARTFFETEREKIRKKKGVKPIR